MARNLKYPIGIQSFSEIISGNYLYIDKTEYIYKLVSKGKYYFLSRPRRFGKSLLLSTMEAFFLGKRELFKGLAIDRYDDIAWEKYPVLHIDLNAKDYTRDNDSLYNQLDSYLKGWEQKYGINPDIYDVEIRFANIIRTVYRETGMQVVVLIDEYDKPLLQNLIKEREDRQNLFRDLLKGFYGVLKSCDPYIKFAFLTGVTKFGKVSVFSDLNNLRDLTLEPEYNSICGVTESELIETMRPGIELLAERQHASFSDTVAKLKRNYDGYRFSEEETEGVYNPFSLLNVMESQRFADYWFMTATPTMLIELLRETGADLTHVEGAVRTESELMGLDPVRKDPIPLLFQSGYLTIKGTEYDLETEYKLGFPNEEVERGFLKALLPYYVNADDAKSNFKVTRFVQTLREGDIDEFMKLLKALLAGMPYNETGDKVHEDSFRNVMYIVCKLMGMSVQCELHTGLGRIDLTVETDSYIYVMEFKVDKSPETALAQIEEKHYADRYLAYSRTVVKVGVEFSSTERNITAWAIATE